VLLNLGVRDMSAQPVAMEGKRTLVGRPGFKPGEGRLDVSGGFDSHSFPPTSDPLVLAQSKPV
jgi:hypothetical protein